jgi:Outer membrane protein beta-barrel domain
MRATHVFALVGVLASQPAIAQGPLSLDVGGGPSFQFGNLKTNTAAPGFDGLVGLHAHAPFVPISIRVEGLYDEYDHTGSFLGAQQIWAISGNAIYSFPNTRYGLVPYVLGGGGYYHTSENLRPKAVADCPTCESPTVPTLTAAHFGVDGGVGARYRLFGIGPSIGIGIFAEARYLYFFGPHTGAAMVPLVFGVSFPTVTESQ